MSPRLEVPATPRSDDLAGLDALRSVLRSNGFVAERVEEALGTTHLTARRSDRTVHMHRLSSEQPFDVLARFLLLEEEIDMSRLRPVLAPLTVERLEDLGICTIDAGVARSRVKLVPHGDYFVACDPDAPGPAEQAFDYVPGVQAPSVTLAKLAVRLPVASALDLGTGSGLQALLAAKHCERVIATDVNSRALAFASFNARLNGLENIDLRLGAGLDPVAGERFDLIVSNPPYVISPDHSYAYRDSGLPADEICRSIVQTVPEHLNEGGFAHILVSWAAEPDQSWDAPLREWVQGNGCDAWLLHYRTRDALAHASGWLQPLAEADPAAFEPALDRWLEYLRRHGIEAVAYGAVVLRRRRGEANWIRTAQLSLERLQPASDHTLRVFAGNDLLNAAGDDSALLAERLRLAPQHRVHQMWSCSGGFEMSAATLELADGLSPSVNIDQFTMRLLPYLDGTCPLKEALQATAAGLELTDEARKRFATAALPAVRRLLELGFVVPVMSAGSS